MAGTPYRRAERTCAPIAIALALAIAVALAIALALAIDGQPSAAHAAPPLVDAPVIWHDDDRDDVDPPRERDPNLLWSGPESTFLRVIGRHARPSRFIGEIGTVFGGAKVGQAANVNALGEVPSSSWFTNRIGLFPMSPVDVARGPGPGTGPDTTAAWTIVSAKTEGVTPGFNVRDVNGDLFLIKFDSPLHPSMATGAGAISARVLHAAGYNVPDDVVVYFPRDRLTLGENVKLKLPDGSKRPMTEADIDRILSAYVPRNGRWRAISSRFLHGRSIGPFDYQGRRGDDPNDRIRHENRRELRGLFTFAAWIAHFDTKQQNTLDMYIEENGRRYVEHHLIDFASTLGTGAHDVTYRWGYEYTVDLFPVLGRILALGFHEDDWRRLRRPAGLPEVGMWESDVFDPMEYKPLNPNPAFANQTKHDAYWAAKIISAFTDAHLTAIAETARYENPAATRYVARILAERRDEIARAWFDEVAPLDFFRFRDDVLEYRDLGAERSIYPGTTPRYHVRFAAVDAERRPAAWTPWIESYRPAVSTDSGRLERPLAETPLDEYAFLAFELRVDRGRGWSDPVRAYVSRSSERVVAVER